MKCILPFRVILFYFILIFQLVDREIIYIGNLILLGFSLLYLPQLLLALVTTLDTKYTSLTILWNHPSLILLPLFTFFTFSKPHNFCRSDPSDNRVMFSVKYTKINLAISVVCYVLFCSLLSFTILTESDFFQDYYVPFVFASCNLLVVSMILTMTFIYFDQLFCCCCRCFLSSKQQIVVHDPEQPDRIFHLVDGEIVEVHENSEGMRSIFIEMNIREALTAFTHNLNLSAPEPSVATANVSQ